MALSSLFRLMREVAAKVPGAKAFYRKCYPYAFPQAWRDENTLRSLLAYKPNSAGSAEAVAFLTVQSANQTFPMLATLINRAGQPKLKTLTASQFRMQNNGGIGVEQLAELFNKYGSDKSSHHDYHLIYGTILRDPSAVRCILEVGLGTNNTDVASNMGLGGRPGASLRAFREFMPNADIYGADVDKRVLFQDDRIQAFFVDQTEMATVDALADRLPAEIDLIIDDGLHSPNANIAIVTLAITRLRVDGWLVIEDIAPDAYEIWQVVSSLLPQNFSCVYVEALFGRVFIVQRTA